ncbi:hypothetical protein [Streptomyces sp. Isolate_219]|uniref:hypothetical protein n=1 Tax=Streptomyces sp. Isolate_219 TaxID=2950110 RepID=UPI0021C8809E|nr:hypothetical protein [Streptomyces sp. Isolate_219]MCR8576169.1 hypothetical protein [Streptomyces sp. Isolate_219]
MQLRNGTGFDAQPIPAESEESKLTARLNTASTLLTAVIAIPALVISLITYFDAKSDTEESDEKEAARISWYFRAEKIVVENRSLRPVYDLTLERDAEDHSAMLYVDDIVSPCSRVTFNVKGHEKEIAGTDNGWATFRVSRNTWWWSGYEKGLQEFHPPYEKRPYDAYIIGSKWARQPKYEDLDGCG